MLSENQTRSIKEQLISQINSSFPENKKTAAVSQIEAMDTEQLEQFLIQNKLIRAEGGAKKGGGQCIFCSIVFGDLPSTKIGENGKAIAILELNPISKGHTIIIPKEHVKSTKELPKEVLELAGEIGGKLKVRFRAKDVIIEPTNMFGHEIINVLPIYDDETLDSPKKQSNPEELAEIKKEFEEPPRKIAEEEKKEERNGINEKSPWLKERIP